MFPVKKEATFLPENNVNAEDKNCGSDILFISFVNLNKFLYIPKA